MNCCSLFISVKFNRFNCLRLQWIQSSSFEFLFSNKQRRGRVFFFFFESTSLSFALRLNGYITNAGRIFFSVSYAFPQLSRAFKCHPFATTYMIIVRLTVTNCIIKSFMTGTSLLHNHHTLNWCNVMIQPSMFDDLLWLSFFLPFVLCPLEKHRLYHKRDLRGTLHFVYSDPSRTVFLGTGPELHNFNWVVSKYKITTVLSDLRLVLVPPKWVFFFTVGKRSQLQTLYHYYHS